MSDIRRQQVQYLEEKGLVMLSKKDDNALQKKRAPKVKGKHFSNYEYLAEGNLTWLTPDESNSFPSYIYDPSQELSYFEQCFETTDKLGEGSFGSVLKVLFKDDEKFYALKVSKEPFKNDNDRKWKLDEVEHHKQFSGHPCIVSLHQAWEEDRYMYMMMDLCQHNLAQVMAVPEELCWQVLTDITLALDHIHDLGMGHFDVKLENILYGFDGRYKLSDFGLVYDLRTAGEWPPMEGDAKYLAPELLGLRREHFTAKADIFSLGISILELAGDLSLPPNGPVWEALRENTFPLAQTQKLSDELFFLLVRMMSPNASLRPSAKEILDLPPVKAVVQERRVNCVNSGLGVAGVMSRSLDSTVQLYLTACAAIGAIVELVTSKVLGKTTRLDSSTAAISGRQPLRSVYTSTPYCENDKLNNNSNFEVFLNSRSSDGSLSPVESSLAPAQQVSDASDWRSPSFHRYSSLHDTINLRYTSPSTMPYGVSPIRLSKDMKAVVKARKAERMQKIHHLKRNLLTSFDEDELTSTNPNHFVVEKRQRMMRPRNLTSSFDNEYEV